MDKATVRTDRMRSYFIQSAKQILKGEGLRGISVRNIADDAGYSYATLYNYFKDLNEVIFECVKDFQQECAQYVKEQAADAERGIEKIKTITWSYAKFFIQYPGIFELFFLEHIHAPQKDMETIYSFLSRLCGDEWGFCVEQGMFLKEEAETRMHAMNSMVTGMLVFYLNRRIPATFDSFSALFGTQIGSILETPETKEKQMYT